MGVLEIGAEAYTAALITELIDGAGEVTSINSNPHVLARTRRLLAAAGYHDVAVVHADTHEGEPTNAPYDRVLVTADTVATLDTNALPTAWIDQLVKGGRLVMPPQLPAHGLTQPTTFQRKNGQLLDIPRR